MVKRTSFRLRGVPHTLLVLSDVSAALREEERIAWERLIRVLGHEINNSLTPIKSIAGSLRGRLAALQRARIDSSDFERGLGGDREPRRIAEPLPAGLSAVDGPACAEAGTGIAGDADGARGAAGDTGSRCEWRSSDVMLLVDADQIQQALINLVRNAAEAALSPDAADEGTPQVEIAWETLQVRGRHCDPRQWARVDQRGKSFVPFYTTKPGGTGIGLVLAQQIAQAHQDPYNWRTARMASGVQS